MVPAAAVAAIFTGGAITTGVIIGTIIINLGLSALLGKVLAPKIPKSGRDTKGLQNIVRSNIMPRRIIYGEAVTGGPYALIETTGVNNIRLNMIVILAAHPVEDIIGVMIDDEYVDISGNTNGTTNDDTNDLSTEYVLNKGKYGTGIAANHVKIIKNNGWGFADFQYVTNANVLEAVNDRERGALIAAETQSLWTQPSTARDSSTGLYTSSGFKLTNCAHIFLQFKFNRDVWSGFPKIKFHVKGKRLYNPDLDNSLISEGATGGSHDITDPDTFEYSEDWSLCILDYLLNKSYGLAAKITGTLVEIDWSEMIDSYTASSNLVDTGAPSPDPNTAPRYTINGVLETSSTPISNIEAMLTSGGGDLIYAQGKYKLRPAVYRLPDSENDIINEDMIVSPLSIRTHTPRSELFNKAAGVYVDRGYSGATPSTFAKPTFEPTDFAIVDPLDSGGLNPYEVIDDEEIIKEFDFPFTIREWEAQRLARIQLERVRQGLVISFEANLKAMQHSVGDTVYLEILNNSKYSGEAFFNRLGLDDTVQNRPDSPFTAYYKQFKILEMQYTEQSTILMVLIEESEEIYDWNGGMANLTDHALESEIITDDPTGTIIPPSFVVNSPYTTIEEVVATEAGTTVTTLIRWSSVDRGSIVSALDAAHIAIYRLEYGIVTNPSAVDPADRVTTWIAGGSKVSDHNNVTQGPLALETLYKDGATYDFRIRGITYSGRQSEWTYYSVDIGSDYSPGTPVSSSINLIDTKDWTLTPTTPMGDWEMLTGALSNTSIKNDVVGPYGEYPLVMEVVGDGTTNPGWYSEWRHSHKYDKDKSYVYYLWVKRIHADSTTGLYIGFSSGTHLASSTTGTPVSNPYIATDAGSELTVGEWYLAVGVIHPDNTTVGETGIAGVYDPATGLQVINSPEFEWNGQVAETSYLRFGFYDNVAPARAVTDGFQFTRVVAYERNGSEPTIESLLRSRPVVPSAHGAILGGVKINYQDLTTPNSGEMYVHGVDGYGNPTTDDAIFMYDTTSISMPAELVLTSRSTSQGFIVYDMAETGSFTGSGGAENIAACQLMVNDGVAQWQFDDNSTTWVNFTPTANHIIVGRYVSDTDDVIAQATLTTPIPVSTAILSAARIEAASLRAVTATIGNLETRPDNGGVGNTTPRLTLQDSTTPLAIYDDDDETALFSLSDTDDGFRLQMLGDFEPGTLNSSQAFSNTGISDLRGRLGLSDPSGVPEQRGGDLHGVVPVAAYSATPKNILCDQLPNDTTGDIVSNGGDVTLTFKIFHSESGSGTGPGISNSDWSIKWQYSKDAAAYVDVPSASYTGITGIKQVYSDPGEPVEYDYYLSAQRQFVWTGGTVADSDYRFRIVVTHNSGYTAGNITVLTATEPLVNAGVIETHTHESTELKYLKSAPETTAGIDPPNLDFEWSNVIRFGATGDGVTDDTAAIQDAFDSVGVGQGVYFPPGDYLITAAITLSSKDNVYVLGKGATIKETSGALTEHLQFTSCDNMTVQGLMFEAGETEAYFDANTPLDERQFLEFITCDFATVLDIRGKNKRRLLTATDCFRMKVDGYVMNGFMPDPNVSTNANGNNAPAMTLRGCDDSTVSNGRVYNHGSACLLQGSAERVSITGIVGRYLQDNGVYISSGISCTISGCSFKDVKGDGVKARGHGHSIVNNTLENVGISPAAGCSLEPLGLAGTDNENAAGFGGVIMGNTIRDSYAGIRCGEDNNKYMRDVVVCGNVIENCKATGQIGAIELPVNRGVTVTNNIIRDYAGDYAIFVQGQHSITRTDTFVDGDVTTGTDRITLTGHEFSDANPVILESTGTLPAGLSLTALYYVKSIDANTIELYADRKLTSLVDITAAAGGGTHTIRHRPLCDVLVKDNICRGGTGSAAATRGAIKINYCSYNLNVSENIITDVAPGVGVRLFECRGGIVSENIYLEGQVVRIPSGENNFDIQVFGNKGATTAVDPSARASTDFGAVDILTGEALRIYDSSDADYGQFSHDGTNFNTQFVGTDSWNVSGTLTNVFKQNTGFYVQNASGANKFTVLPDSNVVNIRDGMNFRIRDNADTDWANFVHDGVDFTTEFVNTANWDITHLTGTFSIYDSTGLEEKHRFFSSGGYYVLDGGVLKIFSNNNGDDADFNHDGTDFRTILSAGTTDWVVSGLTGRIKWNDGSNELPLVAYPRSQGEIDALVTPTNFEYIWGDIRRYGAKLDGVTSDHAAFVDALDSNDFAYVPGVGVTVLDADLTMTTNQQIRGDGQRISEILVTGAGNSLIINDRCQLKDFRIYGEGAGGSRTVVSLIKTADTAARWRIQNISANNAQSLIDLQACWIGTIDNALLFDSDQAIYVNNEDSFNDPVNNINIYDGEIANSTYAIRFSQGTGGSFTVNTVNIRGMAIEPSGTYGVWVEDVGISTMQFDGVHFEECGAACYRQDTGVNTVRFDHCLLVLDSAATDKGIEITAGSTENIVVMTCELDRRVGSSATDAISLGAGATVSNPILIANVWNDAALVLDNNMTSPVLTAINDEREGTRFNESIYLQERGSAPADIVGQGQVWVKNEAPNKLMFTDDAGNDFDLSAFAPDVSGATDNDLLYRAAGVWVDTASQLTWNGTQLRVWDGTIADYVSFEHTGTVGLISTNNNSLQLSAAAGVNDIEVISGSDFRIRDQGKLVLLDSTDTDTAEFQHDGTDLTTVFTGTTDWVISGLTGDVKINDGTHELPVVVYPRSAEEIAASVTPTNFQYIWGDIRRYGASSGGADNKTAIENALKIDHPVYVPAGDWRINSKISWDGGAVRMYGDGGYSSQIAWYGGTDTMLEIGEAPRHGTSIEGINFDGRTVADKLIHVGVSASAGAAVRQMALIRCLFQRADDATSSAIHLGDYTDSPSVPEADIAQFVIDKCEFLDNTYNVTWDSNQALGVTIDGSFFSRVSPTTIKSHINMVRGGNCNIKGSYFGGNSVDGTTACFYVKDGAINVKNSDIEFSFSTDGALLHLDTPALATSNTDTPSSLEGCRVLNRGLTAGSGHSVIIDSNKHSLHMQGCNFYGRSAAGTQYFLKNDVGARVTSINNFYRGRPWNGTAANHVTSLADRYDNGTTVRWLAPSIGIRRSITNVDSPYTVQYDDHTIESSSGTCTVNLPACGNPHDGGTSHRRLTIVHTSTTGNGTTIARNGSNTIDGTAANLVLTTAGESVTLESDGFSDWMIVARVNPRLTDTASDEVITGQWTHTADASVGDDNGTLNLRANQPGFTVVEEDAPTDEQNWIWLYAAGNLELRCYDDAWSAAKTPFTIQRAGTTSTLAKFDSTTLESVGQITASAVQSVGTYSVKLESTQPGIAFSETDAATDESNWDIVVAGKILYFRARADAWNGGKIIFTVTRGTGTAVTNLKMEAPLLIGSYLQNRTATTSELENITHAVNTDAGKVQGAQVYNSTTDKPVWAVGSTDGAVWVDATGSTAHTPVTP